MAKGSKLKEALDRHKGVDKRADHQKKIQKQAEKRKRSKLDHDDDEAQLRDTVDKASTKPANANADGERPMKRSAKRAKTDVFSKEELAPMTSGIGSGSEQWETDEENEEDPDEPNFDLGMLEDSDLSESEGSDVAGPTNGDTVDAEEEDDKDEDIPLSDIESLASEDKGDVIPHQRLTINNTAALLKAHKSISLPSNLSFSANQTITSQDPTSIPDIDDDLSRELAFYKQSLEAVTRARPLLKAEGIPFSRPADYFAEMVKSDEHMTKIKQKLVDEAAGKRAAADARKQRDLRKFGKQVQVAKLQERDRTKKETIDKINLLKRSQYSSVSSISVES